MRYLLLSDIHSNLEALEAVLEEASGEYDSILCCGDLVGYGPDPGAVVDRIRDLKPRIVRGNHDKAVLNLSELAYFNPLARAAAFWTREQLSSEQKEYLRILPQGPLILPEATVVHGSLLDEDEYLFAPLEAGASLQLAWNAVTFMGHTHVQGGFIRTGDGEILPIRHPFLQADKPGLLSLLPDSRYLINPGSVGQPRDRDPRAAFAIFEPLENCVKYLRVEYPVKTTQEKMRKAGLPDYLIERLSVGK
jgi:predicted phosphodiesterase